MKLYKSKPFKWLPKLVNPICAGADGWDGGLGIVWLNKILVIRQPDSWR